MFQREVIGNVGSKPAYGNAVGGVNSFWRTSEIRAGIILEAAYQSQVGSHTYCPLCWKLSVIALVRRGRYRKVMGLSARSSNATMVPVLVEFHSVHVLFDVVGSYRMDSL